MDRIRKVYLNRNLEGSISRYIDENSYSIVKVGQVLKVRKCYSEPRDFLEVKDERHYTTTIEITLKLFEEHNAEAVLIRSEEKFLPFRRFCTRFLEHTKDDHYIYDFVGTNRYGNPWAEAAARQIKRRFKWQDNWFQSVDSAKRLLNLNCNVYNIFFPQEELGDLSPFRYAGAKFDTYEEAWELLFELSRAKY